MVVSTFHEVAQESLASQGKKELEWLLVRLGKIRPKIILEIGVHQGYSIKTWEDAFWPNKIIGIENDPHDLKYKDFDLVVGDSHNPETVLRVKKLLNGEKVDFLFIDGDHMYEGVKNDFEMYKSFVREGGIIAFDDMDLFGHPQVQVYNFWDELLNSKKFFMESSHTDSNGIGILYV